MAEHNSLSVPINRWRAGRAADAAGSAVIVTALVRVHTHLL